MNTKLIALAVVGMLCASTAYAQAAPSNEDCRKLVVADGFLTRAQAECDIAFYSEAMKQSAGLCYDVLNRKERSAAFNHGVELFDENKLKNGHTKLCARVRLQFPQILRDGPNHN
jgi:hypothetical protein